MRMLLLLKMLIAPPTCYLSTEPAPVCVNGQVYRSTKIGQLYSICATDIHCAVSTPKSTRY